MATAAELGRRIDQARGATPADLVLEGGQILNVATGTIEPGTVAITGATISGVYDAYDAVETIDAAGAIIVPGFIDTHVHVESSMVAPGEFERLVLSRGTTTAVCDPHEIANVLGDDGIRYMLDEAARLTMTLAVKLSSCVPSSALETSGAALAVDDLVPWRDHQGVHGLAEVMSFPAVLAKDPGLLAKLEAFQGRPIDGHAPLLHGRDLSAYLACGIRTDHETTRLDEAEEKLRKGMALLLREGSVAKNVTALAPMLTPWTAPRIAFCTDDRNPNEIVAEGHIDHALRLAIAAGVDPIAAYRSASLSAAEIMGFSDRGLIAPGYRADLLLVDDLRQVSIRRVICGGRPWHPGPGTATTTATGRRSIRRTPVSAADFPASDAPSVPTIGIRRFSLLTDRLDRAPGAAGVLRLAVLERHGRGGGIGLAHVEGLGPLRGAVGISVGHDCHNLTIVGSDPADMAAAANRLIDLEGGAVAVQDGAVRAELALPIAGLMSDRPYEEVASGLDGLKVAIERMGATLEEPLLHLAFLPLVVIPHLKLSDRGLVDVDRFTLLSDNG